MMPGPFGPAVLAVLMLAFGAVHGRAAAPRVGADQGADSVALAINIPAFRLELLRNGRVASRYPITVGQRRYPTPTGAFTIERAELNPSWTPPASEWAADAKRTPPGPRNPMGRAKLMFLPLYYVHGTPDSGSLGGAGSHGCVRMSNPDVLQLTVDLIRAEAPETTDSSLAALIAGNRRTRVVVFERPVPIALYYRPIEIADDVVLVHHDVYRLWADSLERDTRERLEAALQPRPISAAAMAELVERMRSLPAGASLTIPLDSIARGG